MKSKTNRGRYCFAVRGAKLTITGGEIDCEGQSKDRYIYSWGKADITISGGNWGFNGAATQPSPAMYIDSPSTLRITGGRYNFNPSKIDGSNGDNNIGTVLISGGTFISTTKPTKHLAEGYQYVSTGSNEWTVKKINPQEGVEE